MALTNWEQTMTIASRSAHFARHATIDAFHHLVPENGSKGSQPWI